MGISKSPVDELVDGMDAIGTILDENLPQIRNQLNQLTANYTAIVNSLNNRGDSAKEFESTLLEVREDLTNLDLKLEDTGRILDALPRRIDQLQKSIIELTVKTETVGSGSELADAVKMLEDRLRKIEKGHGESH